MNREQVVCSDCLEHMRTMPENSVDSIVTDPPYGLAFMGAKWDSFNGGSGNQTIGERQAEGKRYADENKGAPRYANSHGKKVTQSEMVAFQSAMTPIFEEALRVAKPGAHLLCFGGTRTFHRMACAIEDAGWEIRDCIMWVYGSGLPHGMDVGKKLPEWDGWNTALKPAWEPIIVARKPLDGTVAHNVLTWGVGAMNIDGCRVPTGDKLGGGMRAGGAEGVWDRPFMHDEQMQAAFVERKKAHIAKGETLGRFPANLVHDGSQMVLDLFPESKGQQAKVAGNEPSRTGDNGIYGRYGPRNEFNPRNDSGSAARFFYCAKASKKERGEGNHHPTIKPLALMRWLVTLVTPEGGVVLDPFAGSGTTLVACKELGGSCIGIEREPEYVEIIKHRLETT